MQNSTNQKRFGPNRQGLTQRGLALCGLAVLAMAMSACEPSIRVKVDPITIYAKLDVNVKLQLDKDVKDLVSKNPDLF